MGVGRGRFPSAERSSAPVVAAERRGSRVLCGWDGRFPQGWCGGVNAASCGAGGDLPQGAPSAPRGGPGWTRPLCGTPGGIYLGERFDLQMECFGPVLLLRGAPPHPPSRCGCGLGGAWPAVRSAAGFTSRGAPSPPLMALGGEMCLSAVLAALLSQGEPPDPQTQLWRWGNTFM